MRVILSCMILIHQLGMTPKARVSYPILYDIHTSDFTVWSLSIPTFRIVQCVVEGFLKNYNFYNVSQCSHLKLIFCTSESWATMNFWLIVYLYIVIKYSKIQDCSVCGWRALKISTFYNVLSMLLNRFLEKLNFWKLSNSECFAHTLYFHGHSVSQNSG